MSENIYEKLLARAVIRQAIKDVEKTGQKDGALAMQYVLSPRFKSHCEVAGYPKSLADRLLEFSELSPIQRKFTAKVLLKQLNEGLG